MGRSRYIWSTDVKRLGRTGWWFEILVLSLFFQTYNFKDVVNILYKTIYIYVCVLFMYSHFIFFDNVPLDWDDEAK